MSVDVVERFLDVARRQPRAPAVVHGGVVTSYGEMAAAAWGMAGALERFGPPPRVAILLPQGAAAYQAMFATLMAGGVYLPCNTASPTAKLSAILASFRPDVMIGSADHPARPRDVPVLDGSPPDHGPPSLRPVHRLAYVIFTSGSTGMPKGVMIPRSALNHYVAWALDALAPGPGDRWSQHPNIGFDLSVLDVFGALCSGAALYPLTSPVDRMLPGRFVAIHGLTLWNSVPSVVDMMVKAGDMAAGRLRSLRLLHFCGEPLYPAQVEAIFAGHPTATVINTYGPTECTVACTQVVMTRETFRAACGDTVSIGEAMPGIGLHLLDGAEGTELALSGPQLADGYWQDAPRTDAVFRMIPAAEGCAVRAYLTGDLVSRRDGRLFFERRRDTQVKIRGHRLELGEVESAIRALGHAGAVCVVAEGRLHAFVVGPEDLDAAALLARLAERLDPHAVPAYIHAVAGLPRTANDKVDTAELIRRAISLEIP